MREFISRISSEKNWVWALSFLFLFLNAFLIYKEFFWFMLLPVAILAVLVAILSLELLFFAIVFLTPLSVNLERLEFGLGVALPTEPLILGVMIIFLLRTAFEKDYDSRIIRHPISLVILLQLAWILVTTFTSEMPLVSIKFLISRMWFVIVFFFLAVRIFSKPRNFRLFLWLYILPLVMVITYTVIHHSTYGFAHEPAHWVMTPFYKDHTSYGAIMAMYLPPLLYLVNENYSRTVKFFTYFLVLFFVIGIILSYTRAAWVSLAGAAGLYFVYKLRIRFSTLMVAGVSILLLFLSFRTEIILKLEKNRQDSSDNLTEHIQSISNVSSDASNLERLNRWESAYRMFKERPYFGWGPGTYAFQYAPFQVSSNLTIISTNAGDMGNAHSEYIGPLAEQGIGGMILMVLLVIVVFIHGTRVYTSLRNRRHKAGLLSVLLGLSTYFVHGLLNNFLDTDKASVPVWGFIAVVVAMDLYYPKQVKTEKAGR